MILMAGNAIFKDIFTFCSVGCILRRNLQSPEIAVKNVHFGFKSGASCFNWKAM